MKRALFPPILILLVLSLLPSAMAGPFATPSSSTPAATPTPVTSVITWSQPTPLRAPVRVVLNMDTVWALVVDPQSPGTVYVGTPVGVCKSDDRGRNWQTISAGLPVSEVPALAVDPRTPRTLYASSWRRGVFKSTNGGVTWQAVNEGLTNLDVQALALDPGAPDTVYAGTYGGGVFKSTDGGATWQAYNEGLAADTKVLALAVDPQAPGTVYMGASEKGVFKSTDGGVTWPAASEGLTNRDVWALAVDPQSPGTVYAGTSGGVFKSADGGATWQAVNEGLTNLYVRTLTLVPGAVYASTREGGVFKSTNGGATWQAIGKGFTSTVARLAVPPQVPDTIYVGTQGEGVFRSTDGGVTWEALAGNLIATSATVLAIDSQASDTVYAGTFGGVFKSSDGAVTWQPINEGLTSRDVQALAVDLQAVSTVYAGTSEGVFKSTDGGSTWQTANKGLTNRDVRALAVDPQASGTVYAGTWRGGVFKSVDGAATWQAVNEGLTNLNVWTLVLDPLSPATVYVGTLGGGVFKSVDGAATWRAVNEGLTNRTVWTLALDPQSLDTVYAGTEGALFKSADGGLSWQHLVPRQFLSLSVDPFISQVLYAATGVGVNLSRDGGLSWEAVGPPDAPIGLLAINANAPQTLYGVAGETGVFHGKVNRALLPSPLPSRDSWSLPLVSFLSALLMFLAWIHFLVAKPNQIPFVTALRLLPAPRQLALAIGGGYVERSWPQWQRNVESGILHQGRVTVEAMKEVPHQFRGYALDRYYGKHEGTMRINRSRGGTIELENAEQITAFFQKWEEAAANVNADQKQFANLATDLAHQLGDLGFLRETDGQVRSQDTLHGFMVAVPPLLEPKVPPSFPLIFIQQREFTVEDVDRIQKLKMVLGATDTYFAFLFTFDGADRVKEITKRTVYDVDFIVFGKELLYRVLTARDRDKALAQAIVQQASLKRVSPYVIYGPVPFDKVFFGREKEINAIVSAVEEASIALIGGRKMGKTSILNRAVRSLEARPDLRLLRLDCRKINDYAGFFDKLRTLPETQGIPIAEGSKPSSRFEAFVSEVQKRAPDRRIVFVMDEVDALLKNDEGETLFGTLRSLSQEGQCSFVLCGAKVLYERLHAPQSALFNFCDPLILSYLDRESAAKIVTDPMRNMGITLQGESSLVNRILAITSGHPNLIQFLCHTTLEYIDGQGKRSIFLEDVLEVSESDDFKFQEFFMEVVWGDASPLEKIITLLLVERQALNEHEIRRGLQEKGISVTIKQLKQALQGLQLYSILTKRGGQFVFVAEFFPQVIGESQDQIDWLVEEFLEKMKEA